MSDAHKMPDDASNDNRDSIWWITIAPAIWASHFLASYLTAAIFCAKYSNGERSASEVQWAVGTYTLIAIVLIGGIGAIGFSRHRNGDAEVPHDAPSRADQRRLIGWATFLLATLSGLATIFTALVLVFVGSCH